MPPLASQRGTLVRRSESSITLPAPGSLPPLPVDVVVLLDALRPAHVGAVADKALRDRERDTMADGRRDQERPAKHPDPNVTADQRRCKRDEGCELEVGPARGDARLGAGSVGRRLAGGYDPWLWSRLGREGLRLDRGVRSVDPRRRHCRNDPLD